MNYHNITVPTKPMLKRLPIYYVQVLRTFLHNYCSVTNEGAYTVTDRVVRRSYKTVFRLQINKPSPNRLFRVGQLITHHSRLTPHSFSNSYQNFVFKTAKRRSF